MSNNADSPWQTPGLVAYLLYLRADRNLKKREITDAINAKFGLNLTRNSIIGKLFRLRHPERRKLTLNIPITLVPDITPEPEPMPEIIQENTPYRCVGILDLKAEHCRFPFGEHPNIKFCGRQRFCGSYCVEHYDAVHYPPGASERVNPLHRLQDSFQKPVAR